MQKDIRHSWFFKQSPEVVWEHLTNSELIAQWLMANDFKPVVGHQFRFTTKPQPGFDGIVYCEVLEVNPLKKVAYSWKGGPSKGKINLDSVVTWTLTPKDGGTELLLEHAGFKGLKNYMAYLMMNMGWKGHVIKKFGKLLNEYRK